MKTNNTNNTNSTLSTNSSLTLKEVANLYQSNKKDLALSHLFQIKIKDGLSQLFVTNKMLNQQLISLKSKFKLIDNSDIESYFMLAFAHNNKSDDDNSILAKVDTVNFKEYEIEKYIKDKLQFFVQDSIEKYNFFNENTISSDVTLSSNDTLDDKTINLIDTQSFNNWTLQSLSSSSDGASILLGDALTGTTNITEEKVMNFKSYLTQAGNVLEKDNTILTDIQKDYIELHYYQRLTQQEIADIKNVTQKNVSNVIASANNRIKNHYLAKRVSDLYKKDKTSNFDKVKILLNKIEEIEEIFDEVEDEQYFKMIVNFIKLHVKKEEEINYEMLQKNKLELDITTMRDLIEVNLLSAQIEVFKEVTNIILDDDINLINKLKVAEKKRYTKAILSSLNKLNNNSSNQIFDYLNVANKSEKIKEYITIKC